MTRPLPWLLAATLAGGGTAHAAAPDASEAPEGTERVDGAGAGAGAAPAEPTEAPATTDATAPAPASEPATDATTPAPASEPATNATTPAPVTAPTPSPAPTAAADRPAPSPSPAPTAVADPDARPRRHYPRLVIAGGPIVGPHAQGNEECDSERGRCETKGSFIGVGAQVELRVRLWKLLYAHARGLTVGNVSPNDRIYRGLWGAGAGVGLQGRRAFGRAEYLFVGTFGDNHFEPPFYDGAVATDEWGHHAGMLSVGFRQPLPHRMSAELWGGLVIGPRSVRRVPDNVPDERVLTSFLVGLNVSWDVLAP